MNIVLGGGLVGVTTPTESSSRSARRTLARRVPTKTFKTMTQADAPTMERRRLPW